MTAPKLPPIGPDLRIWAQSLSAALSRYFVRNPTTHLEFDKLNTVAVGDGQIGWNTAEGTLNIGHSDGVVQQVGFEQYMRAKNSTGATVANGTVVGFSGVGDEIQISKYIADGTISSLYFIGVTTTDMVDGQTSPVTTFGKVRNLDTSAWPVGTILYASPTVSGGMTATRPTAPHKVISVAAVLVSHATSGEIMVRPTVPVSLDYGSFSDTTVQTLAAANTAYPVKFNTTDISQGVAVVTDGANPTRITVAQAGLYMVSVSNQYTSSSASQKNIQTWLRKNGTNIADSNSYSTINMNGGTVIFATTFIVSMQADDYLQVMWACDDTAVTINNIAATGYSPAAPSTIVTVTQIQL